MTFDVTVLVATFGTDAWRITGERRACRLTSHGAPIVHVHADTLAEARNLAASRARTGWLCFVDADDDLADGYLPAMVAADGDLRAPALVEVADDGTETTIDLLEPRRDIVTGWNPCPIGTLIGRDLFHDVGGFWDEPAWEDWSLFRRAFLAGASLRHVPGAVYRAHVRPDSRNRTVHQPDQLRAAIIASHRRWLRTRQGNL